MKGKELADKIKVSPGTISGWFSDKPKSQGPEREVAEKICEILDENYDDIINKGRPNQDKVVTFKTDLEKEHFEVIQKFDDPQTALEFNKYLEELEKLDVEAYEEYYGRVRGLVRRLRREQTHARDAPAKKA